MSAAPRSEAEVSYAGWFAAVVAAHHAVDELNAAVERLRAAKLYEHSDHLREIAKRLHDAAAYPMPTPPYERAPA